MIQDQQQQQAVWRMTLRSWSRTRGPSTSTPSSPCWPSSLRSVSWPLSPLNVPIVTARVLQPQQIVLALSCFVEEHDRASTSCSLAGPELFFTFPVQDIQTFVQHQQRDKKAFFTENQEVNDLMVRSIQVSILHSVLILMLAPSGSEDPPARAGEGAGSVQGLL